MPYSHIFDLSLISLFPFLLHYPGSFLHFNFFGYNSDLRKKKPADPGVSDDKLMESHGFGLRRVLVLAFCIAGIWSAYIYQGVLQETLSTKRFGPDGERFEHLAFLNLAQNVVCLIWSYIMIKAFSNGSSGGAPWWAYWSPGITNTIGPAMGIEALKYISYPAQKKLLYLGKRGPKSFTGGILDDLVV